MSRLMEKTGLSIRVFGAEILRQRCAPVRRVTPETRQLLSQMSQLMYASSGIGLAAPQVGINACVIVVDIGQGLFKLVNPRITRRSGSQVLEEGCLSVPGVCINVRRAAKVVVTALDEDAKPVRIEAEGLLACVFQHEIDHLKGKLIVDYASWLERIKITRALRVLAKRAENERVSPTHVQSCKLQL